MNTRSGLAQSGLLQHRPYTPQTELYFERSTETVNTGGGKNGCQALALSEAAVRSIRALHLQVILPFVRLLANLSRSPGEKQIIYLFEFNIIRSITPPLGSDTFSC